MCVGLRGAACVVQCVRCVRVACARGVHRRTVDVAALEGVAAVEVHETLGPGLFLEVLARLRRAKVVRCWEGCWMLGRWL